MNSGPNIGGLRNRVTEEVRRAKSSYYSDLFDQVKDCKSYWKLVKKAACYNSSTPLVVWSRESRHLKWTLFYHWRKACRETTHLKWRPDDRLWGARNGAVVRALASHQCGSSSNPGVDFICGLSLLLVLSLASRGFSPGTPVFPSPQKPTFPNSNSTRNQVDEEPLCGCATSKSLFIYLYLFCYLLH